MKTFSKTYATAVAISQLLIADIAGAADCGLPFTTSGGAPISLYDAFRRGK